MNFHPADGVSLASFIVFAVIMAAVIFKALRLVSNWKKWAVSYLLLVMAFSAAALSGVVTEKFIPFGPLLFGSVFIFAITLSLSNAGKELANVLPIVVLIGFQAFRLPLELLLHHWAEIGTIPGTMTWSGQNWDIVTGVIALIAIPFVKNNKPLARVVNLVGFALLINVVRVVVMSSPLPFSWGLEKPLLLLAYFPYCLIGPLFVMPALIGHLLLFRKLLQRQPA